MYTAPDDTFCEKYPRLQLKLEFNRISTNDTHRRDNAKATAMDSLNDIDDDDHDVGEHDGEYAFDSKG